MRGGGVSKAKPPCPFFLSATSLASTGIRQTPLAWSWQSQAHLGHLQLTHGEQSPRCGGPSFRWHSELCPMVAQGTIKPKIQAVKQGVQSKTSNQSHYPSHPPLPTWGTLEMSEHTRGRSSTWSVTTVTKKAPLHLSHQETATEDTECWTSALHSPCCHPLLQVVCSQTEPASSRGVRTEPLHRA